jgi:hypothetical protein
VPIADSGRGLTKINPGLSSTPYWSSMVARKAGLPRRLIRGTVPKLLPAATDFMERMDPASLNKMHRGPVMLTKPDDYKAKAQGYKRLAQALRRSRGKEEAGKAGAKLPRPSASRAINHE